MKLHLARQLFGAYFYIPILVSRGKNSEWQAAAHKQYHHYYEYEGIRLIVDIHMGYAKRRGRKKKALEEEEEDDDDDEAYLPLLREPEG